MGIIDMIVTIVLIVALVGILFYLPFWRINRRYKDLER